MTTKQIIIPTQFKELFNPNHRNILYYGGRSSGKSHATAIALLLRARQARLRILCTREVQNTIRDSVHKLLADLIDKYEFRDYRVTDKSIVNELMGSEFIFKGLRHNTNEIKSTEGIDIAWVEEAQGITENSIDVLTPTIRKPGSQIIFTFNRFHELDPVYVKFVMNEPKGTFSRKVNFDVLEKLGLLPDVIKLEIENDRKDPALFAHKWLGEPISQDESSILDRTAILESMQREVDDDGAVEIGVDVARMGDDRTVMFKRKGLAVKDKIIRTKLRTPEICDQVEAFADFNKGILIKIDDTGVGGGVTDELLKRGYNVMGVNFGGKPSDPDKYPNWISEAWFYLKEILPQISMPMDSDLLMELSTRKWKQDIRGKRAVESKNDYKKRGYRSPDLADALIICFYSGNLLTSEDIDL